VKFVLDYEVGWTDRVAYAKKRGSRGIPWQQRKFVNGADPEFGKARRQIEDLGVHPTQLRSWVKALADDPQHSFPGQGQMKPEQSEIARLKREVAKLKAERDILKKAAAYFAKEST
jgi:transposase